MKWKAIATAPNNDAAVLVYSPDSIGVKIFVAFKFEGEWFDYWRQDGTWPIDVEVTHWMPLPRIPGARDSQ